MKPLGPEPFFDMLPLELIYEDEYYIAINKPAGVMVHKTALEKDPETLYAVQLLRDQIGQKVYPLHRLDRPTSGILMFGKSSAAASMLQPMFTGAGIIKSYLAIVRGFVSEDHGTIDHPLAKDLKFEPQAALTEYWKLGEAEIPFSSSDRYFTSRYSLMKVYPHTGRMHQIRRHFAHIRNYIIGDNTHGDNKQNSFFRRHFDMRHMLLHNWKMKFNHPVFCQEVAIEVNPPEYFMDISKKLGWDSTRWNG
ncbi:MAG: pseudouridine synthase [Cyclobacteriaceae bacterium]